MYLYGLYVCNEWKNIKWVTDCKAQQQYVMRSCNNYKTFSAGLRCCFFYTPHDLSFSAGLVTLYNPCRTDQQINEKHNLLCKFYIPWFVNAFEHNYLPLWSLNFFSRQKKQTKKPTDQYDSIWVNKRNRWKQNVKYCVIGKNSHTYASDETELRKSKFELL